MDQPTLISRHRLGLTALVVAGAAALSGCGSSNASHSQTAPAAAPTTAATTPSASAPATRSSTTPSTSPAAAGTIAVAIKNFAFKPPALTVAPGTKVTFTNDDQTAHTATSNTSGVFDTGTIQPGKSATVTLSKPGTYTYFCQFHAFMTATITVK